MDDFNVNKPANEDLDEPIPFDDGDSEEVKISRTPLNLGSAGTTKPRNVERSAPPLKPPEKKSAEKLISSERITGVKTFYTKLAGGSIAFLDEQITSWLKENPEVRIKRTNTVTGMVIGKKTEPNIIITIWY